MLTCSLDLGLGEVDLGYMLALIILEVASTPADRVVGGRIHD